MTSLKPFRACVCIALLIAAASWSHAQEPAADLILVNGKIVTVDDRFAIAQAVAVKGGRIIAVGKNQEVTKLAGPATQRLDLRGKTVIPGLIDNHAHFIRAAEHWHQEMRLDGITSRTQAVKMLGERVRAVRPGDWIVTLGGWSEEQFTDAPRGFPLEELDRVAPNNPVVLQAVYNHSYLNTAALKAVKIDENTPDPRGGRIEKDASGKPTGIVRDAGGVAFVAAKVPLPDREKWIENTRKLVADLNAMGLTAWLDAGGRGMSAEHYESYKYLAERGLYVNSHVEMTAAIDAFLDEYEAINKERPIKGLRWSFSHLDQVNEAQLERMKRLGMSAQIHSRPLIQGALMHKVHGDKAWEMPPFRRVQDSGIHWGLGSDATAVTTSNPFYTLWLAVTGKMIGGAKVNRQTITREEALIAHTRSNARFLFREADLGSIQRGKYADMLVLDRDYLAVPADSIKDLKPLMTIVGGKIVYDAKKP